MADRNPFVGISSFEEDDHERFFGREEDTEKLMRLIQRYPITILTGPSGFGKSSLVNCGIVKPLREMRLENKQTPVVLVVRNWGQARAGEQDEVGRIPRLFADLLKLAVDDAAKSDPDLDRDEFAKIFARRDGEFRDNPRTFNHLVSDISKAFGGVVLVFDQFEEILRIGNETVRQVSNLINQAKRAEGVSILLSLRNERLDLLQYIELDGPLAQSTRYLEGMTLKGAEDVFMKMAERRGVTLAPGLINSLNRDEGKEADLFYFQAILHEIWEARKPKEINEAALERAFSPWVARDPKKRAFEHALLQIVDRCFDGADPAEEALRLRLRSHAIRMAPLLSSGGFKTNQKRDDLFDKVYGETIRSTKALIEQALRIDAAADDDAKKATSRARIHEMMSGSFKNAHEEDVVDADSLEARLKAEIDESLQRLKGPLLKTYQGKDGTPGEARWELTHDRLGDALYGWSRRHLNRIKDNRCFSLASRGVTPIGVDEEQSGRAGAGKEDWTALSWRGCSIEPARGEDRDLGGTEARFRNIAFEDCDFRGSAFVYCSFENCSFYNCNLNGIAFRACTFRNCSFVDIGPHHGNSVGFLDCRFETGVTFKNCRFTQLTIAGQDTRYETSIEFRGGSVISSRFEKPNVHPGKVIELEKKEDDRNYIAPGMHVTA